MSKSISDNDQHASSSLKLNYGIYIANNKDICDGDS